MPKPLLTEAHAIQQLEELEPRLSGPPTWILGIPADASDAEACAAFCALSAIHHPRRYLVLSPPLADRARRAHQKLEAALERVLHGKRERSSRVQEGDDVAGS